VTDGEHRDGKKVLSVACPGGMARQFRVQVREELAGPRWRLVGSFREVGAAHAAAERLSQAGSEVRVVDCRALPTAA
jgi:hypothetical protein